MKTNYNLSLSKKGTVSMESVDKSVIIAKEKQKWNTEILRALM